MNIMVSWKDSLKLLKPENLKPFLLVTLKTTVDTYKFMNHPLPVRGNWFMAAVLILLISLTNSIKLFNLFWLQGFLDDVLFFGMYFIFCVGMRPSVDLKSWEYFKFYLSQFWYLLALFLVLGLTNIFIIPFLFIGFIFFLFFALDTRGSFSELIQAARNAGVMIVYNLPLMTVLYLVISTMHIFVYYLVRLALSYWGGLTMVVILYLIFIPIAVAFISNIYIKRLHDQPELYFTQPKS